MPRKVAKAVKINALENFLEYLPKEDIEIQPDGWMLPNRIGFSQWVKDTFVYKKDSRLFPSQRFVKDFLQYASPYRGILLYHALGLGKSLASIVSAENVIAHMDVVILVPAALKTNYVEEIKHLSGNNYFSTNQHWKFFALDENLEHIEQLSAKTFVPVKHLQSQKGIWLPQQNAQSNWNIMSDADKATINSQLDAMIKTKYTFYNYDGLKKANLTAMSANGNPFDGKMVIIDEVHNLISRAVNGGQVGRPLFELLVQAKNAKLVLLSGTPLINYPHELSFIVNLIKGPQHLYSLSIAKKDYDQDKLTAYFKAHPMVDTYDLDPLKNTATVQLLPESFEFKDDQSMLVVRTAKKTHEDIIASICEELKCKAPKQNTVFVLPIERDVFTERFIRFGGLDDEAEGGTDSLIDPRMLTRRISGCVSYFGAYDAKFYPTLEPINVLELPMSDFQFNEYIKQRYDERQRELRAKRMQKRAAADDLFSNSGQVYRTFSRASCNFVFPESIKRPYPSKMNAILKELDWNQEEEGKADNDPKKKDDYTVLLQKALKALEDGAAQYLKKDKISILSPKFAKMMSYMDKSPGKICVYSQFRVIEGLGLLSLALETNGWAECKLKRQGGDVVLDVSAKDLKAKKPLFFSYQSNDKDVAILMKIFNNNLADIPQKIKAAFEAVGITDNLRGEMLKMIMVTQSGAEGLSLKGVRQVHIMEPYWNDVRISQVIGRAVRAKSHIELPPAERTVSVYMYIMKLTPKQIKDSPTIQRQDKAATTDQYIYDVAQRKLAFINGIQDLMKNASVDCRVHAKHHPKSACLKYPLNSDPKSLAYVLQLDKEETDLEFSQRAKRKAKPVLKKCTINSVPYIIDRVNGEVYDYTSFQQGRLDLIGHIHDSDDGRKKFSRSAQ